VFGKKKGIGIKKPAPNYTNTASAFLCGGERFIFDRDFRGDVVEEQDGKEKTEMKGIV